MECIVAALTLWIASTAYAEEVHDKAALANLQSVSMICDVNVGEAKLLLRRLELIDETYTPQSTITQVESLVDGSV